MVSVPDSGPAIFLFLAPRALKDKHYLPLSLLFWVCSCHYVLSGFDLQIFSVIAWSYSSCCAGPQIDLFFFFKYFYLLLLEWIHVCVYNAHV